MNEDNEPVIGLRPGDVPKAVITGTVKVDSRGLVCIALAARAFCLATLLAELDVEHMDDVQDVPEEYRPWAVEYQNVSAVLQASGYSPQHVYELARALGKQVSEDAMVTVGMRELDEELEGL